MLVSNNGNLNEFYQMRESISLHFVVDVIPRDNASLGALLEGSVGGRTQNSANTLPSKAYAYGNPVITYEWIKTSMSSLSGKGKTARKII